MSLGVGFRLDRHGLGDLDRVLVERGLVGRIAPVERVINLCPLGLASKRYLDPLATAPALGLAVGVAVCPRGLTLFLRG